MKFESLNLYWEFYHKLFSISAYLNRFFSRWNHKILQSQFLYIVSSPKIFFFVQQRKIGWINFKHKSICNQCYLSYIKSISSFISIIHDCCLRTAVFNPFLRFAFRNSIQNAYFNSPEKSSTHNRIKNSLFL